MPAPSSIDLRLQIVRAADRGARSAAPHPSTTAGAGGPCSIFNQADLRELVEAMPDSALAELWTELQRRSEVRAGALDDPQRALPGRPAA
jgi:hypothetical protein